MTDKPTTRKTTRRVCFDDRAHICKLPSHNVPNKDLWYNACDIESFRWEALQEKLQEKLQEERKTTAGSSTQGKSQQRKPVRHRDQGAPGWNSSTLVLNSSMGVRRIPRTPPASAPVRKPASMATPRRRPHSAEPHNAQAQNAGALKMKTRSLSSSNPPNPRPIPKLNQSIQRSIPPNPRPRTTDAALHYAPPNRPAPAPPARVTMGGWQQPKLYLIPGTYSSHSTDVQLPPITPMHSPVVAAANAHQAPTWRTIGILSNHPSWTQHKPAYSNLVPAVA